MMGKYSRVTMIITKVMRKLSYPCGLSNGWNSCLVDKINRRDICSGNSRSWKPSIEDGLSDDESSGCVAGPAVSDLMSGARDTGVVVSGWVISGSGESAGIFGSGLSVDDVRFGWEENRSIVELVKNGRDGVMDV